MTSMHLIDKRSKRHPDARTPGELAAPAKGYKIYYDAGVTGFGLRVTAAGARTFVLNYWVKGRERRMRIGKYPDFSVLAARDKAKRLKREIEDGHDPQAEIQAAREAPTMADLAARYIEEHLPDKKSREGDRAMVTQDLLPALGASKKVADVTDTDIRKLHRKITERAPYKANRVVALLSKMFTLAVGWKMRPDNPAKAIKRNPEAKRKRYLTHDELARLVTALDRHDDQQAADIVRMLLLTGARSGEVFAMRWDQVDLKSGKWVKPGSTTKQATEHEAPLSQEAVELLSDLREEADDDAVFVFPGRDGTGHRVDIKKPWAAILKAADIAPSSRANPKGLRPHDLRHSFASFLVSAGHSLPTIGALIGHSNPSTTARYAHLHDEVMRAATGQVGALVKGAGRRKLKVVK